MSDENIINVTTIRDYDEDGDLRIDPDHLKTDGVTGSEPGVVTGLDTVDGVVARVEKVVGVTDTDSGSPTTMQVVNGVVAAIERQGPAKFGDGGITDFSEFESDGTLKFNGDARVWDDINMGAISLFGPVGLQPDIEEIIDSTGAGTGIYTYGMDTTDALCGSFELEHSYAEGTNLYFHVHFSLDGVVGGDSDNVKFTLTYTVTRNGVAVPAANSINTGDKVISIDYGEYRADFPAIIGTNFLVGDQFQFTLTRTAPSSDDYSGNLLVKTVGIHCLVNTVGSRTLENK